MAIHWFVELWYRTVISVAPGLITPALSLGSTVSVSNQLPHVESVLRYSQLGLPGRVALLSCVRGRRSNAIEGGVEELLAGTTVKKYA